MYTYKLQIVQSKAYKHTHTHMGISIVGGPISS